MLEELFKDVYEKFKLNFYKSIFKGFEEREANLTPTEILCVEVINALEMPTIKELTEFMETSQSNMAYRVANLISKGYIKKIQSKEDKREYYLKPTEKFYKYYYIRTQYIDTVLDRLEKSTPKEDIDTLISILDHMTNELMPEVTNFINSLKSKQNRIENPS
ncbi:MAG TPA: MarR family transcriptional regulator [Eubacteriaceae bacterium]|jgi:DNA-binding MarR family transcriptional regulator|nr:MarR family transcriptional regulator [Eubacteriaceae bacterium]